MKDYLTIGEFAALRNVDRKSLRYYERIGALVPAYTDKSTKYRYYKLEQLIDLDTILMCLKLGIPLKEMGKYRKEDGTLYILKLFSDGKQRANQLLAELYTTMKRLENSIRAIEENGAYKNIAAPYRRRLGKRYVLRTSFPETGDEFNFKKRANELFIRASEEGLFPVFNFPVGIMAERGKKGVEIFITLEVLPSEGSRTDVIILPEGEYVCSQEYNADIYHPSEYCRKLFEENPQTSFAVITNMSFDSFEKGVFPLEKQILSVE